MQDVPGSDVCAQQMRSMSAVNMRDVEVKLRSMNDQVWSQAATVDHVNGVFVPGGVVGRREATYHHWFGTETKVGGKGYALPAYMRYDIGKHTMRNIARFRTSCHDLHVETGRYNNVRYEDRVCPECEGSRVQDEKHLVFYCEKLNHIRGRWFRLFHRIDHGDMKAFMQQDPRSVALFLEDCVKFLAEQPVMAEGAPQSPQAGGQSM